MFFESARGSFYERMNTEDEYNFIFIQVSNTYLTPFGGWGFVALK